MRLFWLVLLAGAVCFSATGVLAADPDLLDLQRALSRSGYELGKPDGVMGPSTRAAIHSFQSEHGLSVTGDADEETYAALQVPTRYRIPLAFAIVHKARGSRAEVLLVEGSPEVIKFNFDCKGCNAKAASLGGDVGEGMWGDGAEHLHRGRLSKGGATQAVGEFTFGPGGRLVPVVKQGDALSNNRLIGWSFESDDDSPLVFRVVKGRGYVHVGGSGLVRDPSGNVFPVPEGP